MTRASGDYVKFDASWTRVMRLTGWTQKRQLAEFLDIKSQSVSGARNRNSFPADWAHRIAKEFGGSTDWILEGRGPMLFGETEGSDSRSVDPAPEEIEKNAPERVLSQAVEPSRSQPCLVDASGRVVLPRWQHPDPEMFDYIPMAETQLSAGGGCFVISEEIEGYYAFRKTWLSRVASSAKNLVLMRVQGDSMNPTIQDGDTVMIDTGRLYIKEGMLYALRFDSTVMVKRLAFRPGSRIQIISDNRQEYDPFEADVRELHVLGQIIFFCRTFVPD